MTYKPLAALALAAAVGPLACRPPDTVVYPTDRSLETAGNEVLLPHDLGMVYDESLLSSPVADPDLSNLKPAPPPAPEGAAGDASAEASVMAAEEIAAVRAVLPPLAKAVGDQNLAEVPQYFVPEQAEQLALLVPILQPALTESAELSKAMTAKMQAEGVPVNPMAQMDPAQAIAMLMPLLQFAKVASTGPETAAVSISIPGAPQAVTIPMRRTADGWKIEIPQFPPPETLSQVRTLLEAQIPALIGQMKTVRTGLEEGKITTQQAQQQLMAAIGPLTAAFGQLFGQGAAAPSAAGANEAAGSAPGDTAGDQAGADDDADADAGAEPSADGKPEPDPSGGD